MATYMVQVTYVIEAESEQDAIAAFREWITDPSVELEATELLDLARPGEAG